MKRIKTNVMDTPITVMGFITVLCCLLIAYATDKINQSWAQNLNLAVLLIDFLIMIGWGIWAGYILWRQKILTPLPAKKLSLLNGLGYGLIAFWIAVRVFPEIIGLWFIPVDIAIWIASLIIVLKGSPAPAME